MKKDLIEYSTVEEQIEKLKSQNLIIGNEQFAKAVCIVLDILISLKVIETPVSRTSLKHEYCIYQNGMDF